MFISPPLGIPYIILIFLPDGLVEMPFSHSLIIHQEKTEKITTVTVVWICVPNYHKILPTLALNFSENY